MQRGKNAIRTYKINEYKMCSKLINYNETITATILNSTMHAGEKHQIYII